MNLWHRQALKRIRRDRYQTPSVTLDALSLAAEVLGAAAGRPAGEMIPALTPIDAAFQQTIKQLLEDSDGARNSVFQTAADQLKAIPIDHRLREIDALVLDLQRHSALPRSMLEPSRTARYWADGHVLASCTVSRFLRARSTTAAPISVPLAEWLNHAFPKALSTADWGCLRRAAVGLLAEPDGNEPALASALRKRYNEVSAAHPQLFVNNKCVELPDGHMARLIATQFFTTKAIGLISVDGTGEPIWLASPPKNAGGPADPLTAAAVVECLASSLARNPNSDLSASELSRVRASAALAVAQLERTFGSATSSDARRSSRWRRRPLAELVRLVLSLARASQVLSTSVTIPGQAEDRLSLGERLVRLGRAAYHDLVLRCFDLILNRRTLPFEASPHQIVNDCELSHWPGIDIGTTACALLEGRALADVESLRAAIVRDFGIGESDSETLLPSDGAGVAATCPLITRLLLQIRTQLVAGHNERAIHEQLLVHNPHLEGKLDLRGAFVASSSNLSSDSPPTIYTWSTAHSLRAFALAFQAAPDPVKALAVAQDVAIRATNLRKEDSLAREVFNPDGIAVSLIPGSAVALLIMITSLLFLTAVNRQDKPSTTEAYLMGAAVAGLVVSLLWGFWIWWVLWMRAGSFCRLCFSHAPSTARHIKLEMALVPVFVIAPLLAVIGVVISAHPQPLDVAGSAAEIISVLSGTIATVLGAGGILFFALAVVSGRVEVSKRAFRPQVLLHGYWLAGWLLFGDRSNRSAAKAIKLILNDYTDVTAGSADHGDGES